MSNVNLQNIAGSNLYSYFENKRDWEVIAKSPEPSDIKNTGDLHVAGTRIVPTYWCADEDGVLYEIDVRLIKLLYLKGSKIFKGKQSDLLAAESVQNFLL
jgi:hypothetical protein